MRVRPGETIAGYIVMSRNEGEYIAPETFPSAHRLDVWLEPEHAKPGLSWLERVPVTITFAAECQTCAKVREITREASGPQKPFVYAGALARIAALVHTEETWLSPSPAETQKCGVPYPEDGSDLDGASFTVCNNARPCDNHDAETPAEWGDDVRYLTDDRDYDRRNELVIGMGGNGDWYVAVVPEGEGTIGRGVRICTSGGAATAAPGLGNAIAAAYRAILAAARTKE